MTFTVFGHERDRILRSAERTSGSISILGSLFIVVTFLTFPAFNKAFNRLAFYAAFGNIFASTVALISLDGPKAGPNSGLCQFQGFLVQLFMPADAYWILAMAINVHLVFFRRYTSADLRRIEWRYIVACYGGASIPAIVMLCMRSKDGARGYGHATIWCWISRKYDFLRLPLAYAPVGLTDLIVFIIHFRAGRHLWTQRRQIKNLSSNSIHSFPSTSVKKTMQIQVTHSAADLPAPDPALARKGAEHGEPEYSVNIEFDERNGRSGAWGAQADPESTVVSDEFVTVDPVQRGAAPSPGVGGKASMNQNVNRAAVVYFRCALLFSLACLVIWVPSFANRLLTTIHPTARNYPLSLAACICLPLQGFFNALIYTVNSREACESAWRTIRQKMCFPSLLGSGGSDKGVQEIIDHRGGMAGEGRGFGAPRRGPGGPGGPGRSESMRSLKGSEESLGMGRRESTAAASTLGIGRRESIAAASSHVGR